MKQFLANQEYFSILTDLSLLPRSHWSLYISNVVYWNIWNSSRIPTCLCQLPQIPYPRKMRRNHETCSLKQCFHYWALIFCVSILCAFILCVFSVFTLKFRHHQRERKKSRNILWQLFWFMMSHRWLNSSITEHRHLIQ